MKRFFALSLITFASLTQQASALVGGPFDNGFHSGLLENGGVYQAVMTFKNGNGFCYFNPEAQIVAEAGTADTVNIDARGEMDNRAVVYYKGVTYLGSAIGMADGDTKYVQCSINGSSEASQTTQTQQNNNNIFGFGATSTTSASNTIIASQRGFTMNGNWEAKFKQTAPVLRFVGKGELTFIAPSGPDSIAGLAYQGASGLIDAIINSVGNAGQTGLGTIDPTLYSTAQAAINSILTALPAQLAGAGLDATQENGDVVKIKVRGTLRYL